MSYSEKDNQVILTMSREDYEVILMALGAFTAPVLGGRLVGGLNEMLSFMNRLNSGNPHYTPYQVEAEKK